MIKHALAYAHRGWSVFPIIPKGKTPLTPNGLKDATLEADQITDWWNRWPSANIGISCGQASRQLLIVDLDGTQGIETWKTIRQSAEPTLTARTGSGGYHLFFHATRDTRNTAGKLGPNVDTRGTGGYIVAPPSTHPNGATYAWANGAPIIHAPSWLVDLVAPIATRESRPAPTIHDTITPYGTAALKGASERISNSGEGQRNDTLNGSAYSIGRLAAAGHIRRAEAEDLIAAAVAAGLPRTEAEKTFESAYNAGTEHPSPIESTPSGRQAIARKPLYRKPSLRRAWPA